MKSAPEETVDAVKDVGSKIGEYINSENPVIDAVKSAPEKAIFFDYLFGKSIEYL